MSDIEKRSSSRVKRAPARFEALSEEEAPLMSTRKAKSRKKMKMEEYNKARRDTRAEKKLDVVEKQNTGEVEEKENIDGDVAKK